MLFSFYILINFKVTNIFTLTHFINIFRFWKKVIIFENFWFIWIIIEVEPVNHSDFKSSKKVRNVIPGILIIFCFN
jgi:hypothetical protein